MMRSRMIESLRIKEIFFPKVFMEALKNKPTEQEQTFIWFLFANKLVQTKAERDAFTKLEEHLPKMAYFGVQIKTNITYTHN